MRHRPQILSVLLLIVLIAACTASAPVAQQDASGDSNRPMAEVEPTAIPTTPQADTATPTSPPSPSPTTLSATPVPTPASPDVPMPFRTGADVLVEGGVAELHGKRVGLIANQTSITSDGQHLIDVLHGHDQVELVRVFAPEHGVRGIVTAGELFDDTIDADTGVAIQSLYGDTRVPLPEHLADLDVLVYDLQDVGTRFYTFISTMGLAMQAASDAGVEFMVLDRPNPLGGELVDGFMRTPDQISFISQFEIPAVYGMTAGELAGMIAAELSEADAPLPQPTVMWMSGWNRSQRWHSTGQQWVAPSPGLPTADAALAYPGTVLFEATILDYGRGSEFPFTQIGAPWLDADTVINSLAQVGLDGVDFQPTTTLSGDPAIGLTVSDPDAFDPMRVGLTLFVALRDHASDSGVGEIIDRPATFDLLAGTTELRTLLESGASADEIRQAWQSEAATFALTRQPYLVYEG